jgi:hypothetical protein
MARDWQSNFTWPTPKRTACHISISWYKLKSQPKSPKIKIQSKFRYSKDQTASPKVKSKGLFITFKRTGYHISLVKIRKIRMVKEEQSFRTAIEQ